MRKSRVIQNTQDCTPWKQNASTRSATPSRTWPRARPSYGGIFDFDAKFERLRTVNASLEDPSVWNDPKKAQELGKEQKSLNAVVLTLDKLTRELADNAELFEMSKEEGDDAGLMTIEAEAEKLRPLVEELEFRRMFSNEADPLNCFVDIQAGAGGTEACDWASMLLRQYLKYAERKGFKATVEEETPGDVAGIKSATIKIEGEYAYGLLRTETGVHRLVRKSPFDSSGGRHTSFASLFVYPEIDDSIEININPADVRTDTYRASGAGGQHINKTDSAVRLTHMPTGIRRAMPGRSQPAQQPRRGLAAPALQALRARDAKAHGGAAKAGGHQDRCGLGPPDPLVRAGQQPHQGFAHQRRNLGHPEGAGRRPRRFHRSLAQARPLISSPWAAPAAQGLELCPLILA